MLIKTGVVIRSYRNCTVNIYEKLTFSYLTLPGDLMCGVNLVAVFDVFTHTHTHTH